MPSFCDRLLATLLATVILPLALVVALLVRIILGSPVMYRARRAGLHGAPFTMWKFRSMTDARDSEGRLLPDALRLPPFGRLLRSLSLDELPELLNVIAGDMALVGPRPLPVEYISRYTREEATRLHVRPGLTGWAQVNGRNLTNWEDRLAMDTWYVKNRTMWLDLRILVRTISTVIRREGVNAPGEATMAEFRPNENREVQ